MATNNRSQVYLDANDNISRVINQIQASVNGLNASLSRMGNASNGSFTQMNGTLAQQLRQLNQINGSIQGIGGNIGRTALKFASWTVALVGIKNLGESLFDFFKHGVSVTIETETARNGIAGLITSLYDIRDASGQLQQGPEAFRTAMKLADEDVRKLRLDALNTGANFKELRDGFSQALGPGAQLGFSRDQTRQFSTMVANAAKAQGLDKGMVGQEIRALLTGKIDKNATIGTNLGFGPDGALKKQYDEALKTGKAYEFLTKQLEGYARAGEEQAQSLGGTFDSMGDVFDQFAMESAGSLTKSLNEIKNVLSDLYDSKSGEFASSLSPIVAMFNVIGGLIGDWIVGGIKDVISYIQEFGAYLLDNQSILNGVIETVGLIGDVFSGIIGIITTIFTSITDVIQAIFGIGKGTDEANSKFSGMNTVVQIVAGAVAGLNIAIGLIRDTVVIVADAIRLLIGGAIQLVLGNFAKFVGAIGRISGRLGLENVAKDLENISVSTGQSVDNLVEKVIGAGNKFATAPDISATATEKLNHFFGNTATALDKSAEALSKAQSTENKTFKSLMEEIEKRKKDSAKGNADITTTVKNPKLPKEEKKKKGRQEDTGKLAYENELKELEKLAQREKDINADRTRYLELDKQYNLINLQNYFNNKNKLEEEDYQTQLSYLNKELAITEAQKSNAKNMKDANKLDDKANEIINKRNKLEQDYAFNQRKNSLDQLKQVRDYSNALLDLNAQIDDMTGNKGDARTIRLNIEMDNLREKYQADPEALAKINQIAKLKSIQEQFNTISEDFNLILDEQAVKEERINILQQNGRISELDQLGQIKSVRQSYIGQLTEQISQLKKVYDTTKDPSVLISIDKLRNKLLELQLTVDPLKDKFNQLFEDGLTNAFTDFIDGTKSASEAFKDFTKTIEKELLRMASQQVVKQLSKNLFGDSGGGASGGFGGIVSSIFGGGSGAGASSGGGGGWLSAIGSFVGGFFASGGSVMGNKPVVVGEGGPELFFPSGPGYIANAPMTQSLMAGGGSRSGNIIQNITISTPNYNSFNNSDGQVGAQMASALSRAQRNM